jgi:hypothetical protein
VVPRPFFCVVHLIAFLPTCLQFPRHSVTRRYVTFPSRFSRPTIPHVPKGFGIGRPSRRRAAIGVFYGLTV